MPPSPDSNFSEPTPAREGGTKPYFDRPAFVSEEVWSREFPSGAEEVADKVEVEETLHKIAEIDGTHSSFEWVTITLIGLNTILFLTMISMGVNPLSPDIQDLTKWGANVGPLTVCGQWWRLSTSMFLHIGAMHLLFNMWVLWTIGCTLERMVGKVGFAVIYLLAGLCGSLASIIWNPDVVSAGASGAIFGIYGALLGFLLRETQCIPKAVRNKLTQSALLFIGYNMLFAMKAEGIDIAAHIGGLAGGFLCGIAIALPTTTEGVSHRPRTNTLVLIGGLLAVGVMASAIPKGRGVSARLQQAGKLETQALSAFSSASNLANAGRLNNEKFATAIESQVVHGLEESRHCLESLEKMKNVKIEIILAMEECTKAREEAFTRMAAAIRNGDKVSAHKAWEEQVQAFNEFKEAMRTSLP